MNHDVILYLAPLKGTTEIIFRNIYAKYFQGIDIAIATFVPLNHHKSKEKVRKWDIPPASKQKIKTIPQFLGRNLKDLAHLIKWIQYYGYDELNWNLGCPVSKIVKKGRGCGQLEKPQEIEDFLDAIFDNFEIKLSIKTRLGMSHPDEVFKLIEIYNKYPLKELIVHPRIGKQLYSGSVYYDYFEEVLKLSKNPMVYNGDIKTREDFLKIRERFPKVKKIMIGRGVLKDPFLPEKIKGIYTETIPDFYRFKAFHDELSSTLQPIFREEDEFVGKMKEYWRSFAYLFEDRNATFKYVARSKNQKEFESRVEEVLT